MIDEASTWAALIGGGSFLAGLAIGWVLEKASAWARLR